MNHDQTKKEIEKEFDKKFLDKFENRRGVMPLASASGIKDFISSALDRVR